MNENELVNKLLEQLKQLGQVQTPTIAGWQSARPPLAVQGVAVPVAIQTPIGKVRVYFWLGPEAAQSPQALHSALDQLYTAGIPIDAWQEGKDSWGERNGWNGSRRGWRR